MTKGYLDWTRERGVNVSEPRRWPLHWLNFRIHPCPHWPGVKRYRDMLNRGEEIAPVVVCRDCLVILDGWHRVAAHWLEGKRYITVVFADEHYPLGRKDCCRVDQTYHAEKLRAYIDLPFVSGAYRESDWDQPLFRETANELTALGEQMPRMRLWEQCRAVLFLGNVNRKKILDVGTREATVPMYLAKRGAEVTAIDVSAHFLQYQPDNVTYEVADATDLPYADESFDHVVCTACIKHIPGWGDYQAMREMARVVKPGGVVAVSFDYGPDYHKYPSEISGRRIYDAETVQRRIVSPSKLSLVGPEDWSADWDAPRETWPIKSQARSVWEQGYNLQVGFVLLRKEA